MQAAIIMLLLLSVTMALDLRRRRLLDEGDVVDEVISDEA